jgi:hypothetical protein
MIVPTCPARVTCLRRLVSRRMLAPTLVALAFGDSGSAAREPADQDVRADAVLEPVEDGSQEHLGFQIPEPAFCFEQVL